MGIVKKGSQEFEPYARLMNIIGDQLVTDKKIAVIEIIKNCYDADAEDVQVLFYNINNIGNPYLPDDQLPYIEIRDNGVGMTLDTIQNVWMRPATPNKLSKKKQNLNFTTKGRIIQGEKGVGRFAVHKLGEKIHLYTKAKNEDEVKLSLDFTEFNPETIDLFNQPNEDYKLLKDVKSNWTVHNPPEEIHSLSGTLIRIMHLREKWTSKDFLSLSKAIKKLIPPYDPNSQKFNIKISKDFNVTMYIDGEKYNADSIVSFEDVIDRAPFIMNGTINETGDIAFNYHSIHNNRKVNKTLSLLNKEQISKNGYDLYSYKEWFSKINRELNVGSIHFSLYAYDLNNRDKTIITKEMLDFIKDNFVYVFRDGVRVYPFGEKEYDWLELDKLRSVVKAGAFPSYNDLIGFIYISQNQNPSLKDATNRQGMMNIDGAYDDFRYLILAAAEILNTESKIDKEKRKTEKNKSVIEADKIIHNSLSALRKSLEKIDDTETLKKVDTFIDSVEKYNEIVKDRITTVEDLAGLGMAVEKASHDALLLISKMSSNIKSFIDKVNSKSYTDKELLALFHELDENLTFVYDEMQILQPLYKIQRKQIQDVSLTESIEKVLGYYKRELKQFKVNIEKDNDIVIKTNPGLILQVIINLLDNAIYWVNTNNHKEKKITFSISSENETLIIADNGPGIREDITPMIFNEFFSLKANGRGLGLYIVKEILLRIGAEIRPITEDKHKLLPGANFRIEFNTDN